MSVLMVIVNCRDYIVPNEVTKGLFGEPGCAEKIIELDN